MRLNSVAASKEAAAGLGSLVLCLLPCLRRMPAAPATATALLAGSLGVAVVAALRRQGARPEVALAAQQAQRALTGQERQQQDQVLAQVALSEAIRRAQPDDRCEVVAEAWGLWDRSSLPSALRCLLAPFYDAHNFAQLRAWQPRLDSLPKVLRCLNRAGLVLPRALLQELRRVQPCSWADVAPDVRQVLQETAELCSPLYLYWRATQSLLFISDPVLASQAALGIFKVMPSAQRLSTAIGLKAEAMHCTLLADTGRGYTRDLPPLDREVVESGELGTLVEGVLAMSDRLVASEERRAGRERERRWRKMELLGCDEPRPITQHIDFYPILHL